jgi:demethylmenaquinone methyltransferase/2-methoxy-6-polyprenyl-1,4-benzoquinol methylase
MHTKSHNPTKGQPQQQGLGSGTMFDGIAERYDLINKIMSFGMDKRWRKALVDSLRLPAQAKVLDLATGTADVAIAIAECHIDAHIIGLDASQEMLNVGLGKTKPYGKQIELQHGDAQQLPFADNQFDAICVSFGFRNFPDRLGALREMVRTTKSGGRISILELGVPDTGTLAPFARAHVNHVVPKIGAFLSGPEEYQYLTDSIQAFPPPAEILKMFEQAGAPNATRTHFVWGGTNLFSATVP